ncbi:MAG: HlyD family efflux transporter periplasmic adaptor subunit [Pseudomonadota bacterium]
MRFVSRGLWGLFLAISTLGILGLAASEFARVRSAEDANAGGPQGRTERVFTGSVAQIVSGREAPTITTFGEVLAGRTLELRSPEGGRIVFLAQNFENGAAVDQGTTLAQIDPAPLLADRDTAQTNLISAEADVVDASRRLSITAEELQASILQLDLRATALERQQSLSDRGVGTDAALEEAELALSTAEQAMLSKKQDLAAAEISVSRAKADVRQAEIALSEAERKLAEAKIVAPFDGVLSDIDLAEGKIVNANERLGTLIAPDDLEVSVLIPIDLFSTMMSRVAGLHALRMKVSLSESAPAFEAKIVRSDATVVEGQTGRRLFAELDPTAAAVKRPGDFVRVTIIEPEIDSVAWLPAAAVNSVGEILVLGPDNILEEATPRILARDEDRILISTRGLEDAYVVQQRTPQLGRGIKLRPLVNGKPLELNTMVPLSSDQKREFSALIRADASMPSERKQELLRHISDGALPAPAFEQLSTRLKQQG